jgi:hypothetical protein
LPNYFGNFILILDRRPIFKRNINRSCPLFKNSQMHLFIRLAEDSEVCFDTCDKVAACGNSGNADDAAASVVDADVPQTADAGNATPKKKTALRKVA